MTIVGPGRMGLALAEAFARSGDLAEVTVFGRRPEPPRHPAFALPEVRYAYGLEPLSPGCRALFLAVPDDALAEVAHHLAAQGPAPEACAAFHLSGGVPSDVLAPLHAAGYQVGVFHPWVLVPDAPGGADRLFGARIAVTASPEAFRVARDLALIIGADVFQVPAARRALAHAVVSMVESYLPVLVGGAVPLLDRVGLPPEEASEALVPLLRSVLTEIQERGPSEALRISMERVDLEALDVHLKALDGEERRLYAWLRELVALRSGARGSAAAAGERTDRSPEFETASRD